MKNYMVIILDSVGYEQFIKAEHKNIDKIGKAKLAYSHATWTQPALLCFMKGFFPMPKERGYERPIKTPVEIINLKDFLKGYYFYCFSTNPNIYLVPGFNEMFDSIVYENKSENFLECDRRLIIKLITEMDNFRKPFFCYVHLISTHWPFLGYREWDEKGMEMQRKAIEELDRLLSPVFEKLKGSNTHVLITADHAEIFGKEIRGHDPRNCVHPKLLEVFLVEGML